jgi:hypothetical protein
MDANHKRTMAWAMHRPANRKAGGAFMIELNATQTRGRYNDYTLNVSTHYGQCNFVIVLMTAAHRSATAHPDEIADGHGNRRTARAKA